MNLITVMLNFVAWYFQWVKGASCLFKGEKTYRHEIACLCGCDYWYACESLLRCKRWNLCTLMQAKMIDKTYSEMQSHGCIFWGRHSAKRVRCKSVHAKVFVTEFAKWVLHTRPIAILWCWRDITSFISKLLGQNF